MIILTRGSYLVTLSQVKNALIDEVYAVGISIPSCTTTYLPNSSNKTYSRFNWVDFSFQILINVFYTSS